MKLLIHILWLSRVIVGFISDIVFEIFNFFNKRQKVSPIQDTILKLSAIKMAQKIRSRQITCVEAVQSCINRLNEINPLINAMVHQRFQDALKEAKIVDEMLDSDPFESSLSEDQKPLLGLPITVKEAFAVKDCPNCSGLVKRMKNRVDFDAECVTRMRRAGAIPLCVSNVSELCMWWESANRVYGRTRNPYDTRRIVGGSSGGEGAIIGAGACVCGIGSDIGGSIRMPCHFNGIFGHKATSGMVPNDGQFPIADGKAIDFMLSGPMCRYAEDLELLLKIMAGPENSIKMQLGKKIDIREVKVYYMESIGDDTLTSPVEQDIVKKMNEVVKYLSNRGCQVEQVNISRLALSLAIWSAHMSTSGQTKFSTLLADGGRFSLCREFALWMIGLSSHTLPALLLCLSEKMASLSHSSNQKFLASSQKLLEEFRDLFNKDEMSVFLLPTHPTSAPYHNQPLFRWANFAYTGIFNVLGFPATAVPLGLDSKGLPFGIQVVSDSYRDYLTICLARELERGFGGWVEP